MSLAAVVTVVLIGLAIAVMVVSLLLIPLGFPGAWIMLGVLTIGALASRVQWTVLLALVGVATVAEVAEYLIVRESALRWGGSRRAFWGAIIGGFAGLVIGLPVPIAGPLLAGLAGTFAGAAIATYLETRELGSSARIGWGTLIGRAVAAVVKTGAGFIILITGAIALIRS